MNFPPGYCGACGRPPSACDCRALAWFSLLLHAALAAAAILLWGCRVSPPAEPGPPPVATPPATCADACGRGRALGCPGAAPTPAGASCEEVCENVEASGIVSWDLACRADAPSCEAQDACER